MSRLAPAPSATRGELILQPNYFTSSVYVKALRDDISMLQLRYHEAFSQQTSDTPFALFKTVWLSQGWNWLHLKVFDHRTRQTFLDVTLRLFLERTVKTEAPFTRAVALFGLYLFFYTQIKDVTPPLYSIANIPIPFGISLLVPPITAKFSNISSISSSPAACHSDLGPMNPRDLPRELFVDEGSVAVAESPPQKRKGRPTKREKGKKAKRALEGLDEWLKRSPTPEEHTSDTRSLNDRLQEYQMAKVCMMNSLRSAGESAENGTLGSINRVVLERLREASELVGGTENSENVGVNRIEKAIEEMTKNPTSWGVLGLLGTRT
ncbi:hypothetical protein B0H34DRAFT_792438 [Crassisporium funariophilum]|nr:hypothetical protein B0H34DRAFT_792438 [Crassisporium funariophilum]